VEQQVADRELGELQFLGRHADERLGQHADVDVDVDARLPNK